MPITPDTVALARQRYVENVSVKDIARETGLSTGSVYWCVDGCCDNTGAPRLTPLPRRRIVLGRRRRMPEGGRNSLVARLWRTAERQVRDIEERLRQAGQEPAERERDARVMAILVKTVRELATIDEKNPEPGADHDERSLDDFRAELAAKIDAIIAARGTDPGGGPDAASEA